MIHECDGEDHRFESYAARDRRLLALVESFNRRLVAAFDAGLDLTKVLAALDPDPARYTWVDEGGGLVETVLEEAEAELGSAPPLAGFRSVASALLPVRLPAARPAVATSPDGTTLVAWVEWAEHEGERVVAAVLDAAGALLGDPQDVSGPLADCLRPSVAFDGDGTGWLFYGLRSGEDVAVWHAALSKGRFGAPELFSTTAHPSFNQEVVRHPDGRLEACWQGYRDGRFGVFTRRQAPGGFGETRLVSDPTERNVWDPALAVNDAGEVAYAWTSYGGRGYETRLLLEGGGPHARRLALAEPVGYSLHPSIAFGPDGSLWCAYDSVALGGHAGSGPTRLRTRAEMSSPRLRGTRPDGLAVPGDLAPDVSAEVVVRRLDPSGRSEETGTVGSGALVSPSGLPRIAVTGDGSVAVAYRALRRLPLMLYFWDTVVEWNGPNGWGNLTSFDEADGPLEEPSATTCGRDLVVAWQEDGRKSRELRWSEGFGGEECVRRRDHYGEVVWHTLHTGGRIRLARVSPPEVAVGGDDRWRPSARVAGGDAPADARPWAVARTTERSDRYETEVAGQAYRLYWGDLHRHSLISRCTAGDEPELDDFYRYSFDICEYDFWAVTDHAENTSQYQWWSMQKLADILHVKDRFVPFYGFEWTSSTGHQNVVYESKLRGAPIYSSTAEATSDPDRLWAHLRGAGQRSLTIPHHPGSAMVPFDWSYRGDDLMRLVEVFQACRGNYEDGGCFRQYSDGTLVGTFMSDGLRQGHRFGLIASSDHGNGASYVGAFAPELTREAVFSALYDRRTIAATTRDVVVDFRLNDCFMGQVAAPAATATLEVLARGYRDLARLDVVSSQGAVHTVAPEPPREPSDLAVALRVEWVTGDAARTEWSGRLEIEGGQVLETEFWSPEITEVHRHGVAWAAETRNFHSQYGAQRGGVELTLVGPASATVRVRTPPFGGSCTLGELASGAAVSLGHGPDGALALQRGTGGLLSLGTSERTLSLEVPVVEPSWYYVRATLVDGEMAWSSPVWISPS